MILKNPLNAHSIRGVRLENITLPVKVAHKHLTKGQRIDSLDNRIDTLQITVDVDYTSNNYMKDRSMLGVWNYGEVYEKLCLSDLLTISGPLEGILDSCLNTIEKSASEQGIDLVKAAVSADRLGLAVGYPRLSVQKEYLKDNSPSSLSISGRRNYVDGVKSEVEIKRQAGICNYPLVINVDHSWCVGLERVEHVDVRVESVLLSFYAKTKPKTLSNNDLDGLYNYAGLIHSVKEMQGITITGPVEALCDQISSLLAMDANSLGLDLIETFVEVKRTGYARCTPVLKLTNFYN